MDNNASNIANTKETIADDPQSSAERPEPKGFWGRFKAFFRTVGHSCYDMEFYRTVRTGPWTSGILYLLKLVLLLTVVMAVLVGPSMYLGFGEARKYLDENIPDGASLTLSGGQLSAALDMPFVMGDEENKVIIDTAVTGLDVPREQIGDNGVLLGRDAVFVRQNGTSEKIYALKTFPNLSVSKRQAIDWLASRSGLASLLLTLIFAVIYYLGASLGYLSFAIIGAFLAWLFGKILHLTLSYRQWLSVTPHAVTLPIFLGGTFGAIGWNNVPVFPVVFFMIVASVALDERAHGTAAPSPDQLAPTEPPASGSADGKKDESVKNE